ncbi:MAG: type II secretion system protein GspK, partial [Nitrospira sp.]|nr:type II secretion system protein GspK [Nitrospira sp.]
VGSKDVVDEIIAVRADNPFQKISDLQEHILDKLEYTNLSKYIDVKSNFFSITSTGDVNNSRKTITAIVQRQNNKGTILYWRIE